MIRFKTKQLIIRDVRENDFMFLYSIYTQQINMQYISNGKYTWKLEEVKKKYQSINKNPNKGYGLFIIELKNRSMVIGEAGLFNSFNNPAILELGYIIDSDFWKMGLGTEVCTGLFRYAFEYLSTKKLVARMYAENKASVRLSEKLGMKRVEVNQTETGKIFYKYELTHEQFKSTSYTFP